MEENNFTIIDKETGKEKQMKVLFTYENEQRHAQYVFLYATDDEENVEVYRYDDEHNLFSIDDDEEYAEVEEVFDAYINDPKLNSKETK